MTTKTELSSNAGRPRSPDVDRRVFDAAIDVYSSKGWNGFGVAEVARVAKVGKASIYLRWSNRTDLLVDAVQSRIALVAAPETEDLRAALTALTKDLLTVYSNKSGRCILRLALESDQIPGMDDHWTRFRQAQQSTIESIVERAVERGELTSLAQVPIVLDTLFGAAMLHAQGLCGHPAAGASKNLDEYAADLVEFVIATLNTEAGTTERSGA